MAPWLERVRPRLPVVAAIAAVVAGAAAVYSFTAPKRYEARADILVSPLPANDTTFTGFALPHASADSRSLTATTARLVRMRGIAEAVQAQLGLSGSPDDVLGSVAAHPLDDTRLVAVVGKSSNAARAAQIANAFADELVAQRTGRFQTALAGTIRRLRARLRSGRASGDERRALERRVAVLTGLVATRDPTLEVASDAVAPSHAAWPRPWLVIPLAGLAALLVAVTAAALVPAPREAHPAEGPPPPRPAPPPPEPKPQPAEPVLRSEGPWNLNALRRLVEEHGAEHPDRLDAWSSYLFFLREHAGPDGRLPSSFDALVEEEFADLIAP